MEAEYKRLGNKCNVLVNRMQSLYEKCQQSCLKSSRSGYLAMQDYLLNSNKEKTQEDIDFLYNDVYYPIHLGNFFGFSQLVQSTGFLLGFIFERPDVLIKLIKHIQKKPQLMNRLTKFIIPSIFGYFCSDEHLEYAFKFYRLVIQECDSKLTSILLQNFFYSPVMYRFVEAFIKPFIDELGIYIFSNCLQDVKDCIEYFSEKLKSHIMVTSPLINHQAYIILKHLSSAKWKPKQVWEIFWTNACLPIANMLLSTSVIASYKNIYSKILKKITDFRVEILRKILSNSGCYKAPKMDSPSGVTGMHIYVCLDEVIPIIDLLEQTSLRPDVFSCDEFTSFSEEVRQGHFWCIVYPRKVHSKPKPEYEYSLFDDSSLDFLYSYLEEKYKLKTIIDWQEILISNENLWFHYIIDLVLSKHPFENTHMFPESYAHFSKKVDTNYKKQILYLKLIDNYYELEHQQNEIMFWKLDKMCEKVIQDYSEKVQNFLDFSAKMKRPDDMLFFDALKSIKCLDCYNFFNRYFLLIRIFKQILKVGKGSSEYFVQFFIQCGTLTLLSSMTLLGSLLMKAPEFVETCEGEDVKAWDLAESAWFSIISLDPVLAAGVQEFYYLLISNFSKVTKRIKPIVIEYH